MKTTILAALLAVASIGASAQEKMDAYRYCALLTSTYDVAISARNTGFDPLRALGMTPQDLPENIRKGVINQVYFDPIFERVVSTSNMRFEVMQTCLHGPRKPFEPLK
jgi:hypothetical protein